MLKILSVIVLMLGLFSFTLSPTNANQAPAIYPVADAYTTSASPNSAHGTGTRLWVEDDAVAGDQHTYLTFDLSQVSLPGSDLCTENSAGAYLALDVDDTSNGSHELYLSASTSWTESGLKWSNEPGVTGSLIDTSTSTEEDSINDVTIFSIPGSLIDAAGCTGLISFVIVGGTDNAVAWQSRETANDPQLVVDIGD
jgi:hypothetical protein